MYGLYTRIANMVKLEIGDEVVDKSAITIGTGLYNKIKNIIDFNTLYINKGTIDVYGDITVNIKEEIDEKWIINYYQAAINIIVEILAILKFDYETYKEYQYREYENSILYMFTEEFRYAMLEYRNTISDISKNDLRDIYLDIESNIISRINDIVKIICNEYSHMSKDYYFIPKKWVADDCLVCLLIKRRDNEKVT